MDKREIIAGKCFYYVPAPFVTLKVTVESEYHHDKMKKALLNLEEAYPIINDVVRKDGDKMWFEDIGAHVRIVAYVGFETMKWEDAMKHIIQNPIDLTKKPGVIIGIVAKEERFHLGSRSGAVLLYFRKRFRCWRCVACTTLYGARGRVFGK